MAQPNPRKFSMGRRVSFEQKAPTEMPLKAPAPSVRSQPNVLDEEPIPRMRNVAPCIFVPLETDITKAREPPRDRAEKLERLITSMEAQRPKVIENIAYMAERERLAILQYRRQMEAATGIPNGPVPSLPPDEVDWIMGNMAAPAPQDKDLAIKDEAGLVQALARVSGGPPREMTNREHAASELMDTMKHAVTNSGGYSDEVAKRIGFFSQRLEQEKRRLEEAGKRPEERQNAG